LGDAWQIFTKEIIAAGHEIGEGAAYELYVNDCRSVALEDVLTDLYMKLK
jgi:effector-binding domain-containing protein